MIFRCWKLFKHFFLHCLSSIILKKEKTFFARTFLLGILSPTIHSNNNSMCLCKAFHHPFKWHLGCILSQMIFNHLDSLIFFTLSNSDSVFLSLVTSIPKRYNRLIKYHEFESIRIIVIQWIESNRIFFPQKHKIKFSQMNLANIFFFQNFQSFKYLVL